MMIEKDLLAASSTPLVLAILLEGESHGYPISKRVRQLSGGELEWADGMLYPLLHRLHRLGYVNRVWRTAPEGRGRRCYVITDQGRVALAEHKRQLFGDARASGGVRGGDFLPFGLVDAVGWISAPIAVDPSITALASVTVTAPIASWSRHEPPTKPHGFTRVGARRPGTTRGVRILAPAVLDR